MTAHGTIVGVDEQSNLVQLDLSEQNLSRLVFIEQAESEHVIQHGALAGFEIATSPQGVSFIRNDKYLSAEINSATLVADRDVRGPWETFSLIADPKVAYLTNIVRDQDNEMERFCQVVSKLNAERKPVKLYCGVGLVPRSGFLNLDVAMMAPEFYVTNRDEYFIFPFANRQWHLPDNCVDYIFHEDFIEHITQLMQFQFFAETLRVMKPGSWHRVNTPNVIAAMKRHSNFKEGFRGVYTGEQEWGHICIFSPLSLKEMAEVVGYREIVFTTRHHGVSPYAENDCRPGADRDEILGNIYADLLK